MSDDETTPTPNRILIVNADDFGLSHGINRGIIAAHERGIVTSASLMVRWPAATEAATYGREHPALSLGLHLDLREWIYRNENWEQLYEVVATDDITAVAEEATRQLAAFRQLTGRDPTHLDSHQHVHRAEPVHSLLSIMAAALNVPLRHYHDGITYCGDFYGQSGKGEPYAQGITTEALINTLAVLPAGVTELGCHPGLDSDFDSVYAGERAQEVETLCDARVRPTLVATGIELRSFRDFEKGSAALAQSGAERG